MVRDYAVEPRASPVVGPGAGAARRARRPSGRRAVQHRQPADAPRRRAGPGGDGDQLPRRAAAGLRRPQRHDVGAPRRRARARDHVAPDDVRRRRRRGRRHRALPDRRRRDAFSLNARCYEAALATFPASPRRSPPATLRDAAAAGRRAPHVPPVRPPGAAASTRASRPPRVGARRPGPRPRAPPAQHHRLGPPRARRRRVRRRRRARVAPTIRPAPPAGHAGGARRRRRPHRHEPTATWSSRRSSTAEGAPVDGGRGLRGPRHPARWRRRRRRVPSSSRRSPSWSRQLARDERFWLDRLAATDADRAARRRPARASGPRRASTADADDAAVAGGGRAVAGPHSAVRPPSRSPSSTQGARATPRSHWPRSPGRASSVLDVAPDATFAELRDAAAAELDVLGRRTPAAARRHRSRSAHPRPVGAAPVVVELAGATGARPAPEALRIAVGDGRVHLDAVSRPDRPGRRRAHSPSSSPRCSPPGSPTPASTAARPAAARRPPRAGAARRHQPHRARPRPHGDDRRAVPRPGRPHPGRTGPVVGRPHADLRRAGGRVPSTLAGRLAALGVGRGDRVGIAVPRGVDMVVGVLATLELGAAYLPLDPTYPIERLGFMVDDAGIAVLLATGGHGQRARAGPDITVLDPASADGGTRQGAPSGRIHDAGRPRLPDLHVGIDRPAQGRDARAPPGDELLRRHGRASSTTTRQASGWRSPACRSTSRCSSCSGR